MEAIISKNENGVACDAWLPELVFAVEGFIFVAEASEAAEEGEGGGGNAEEEAGEAVEEGEGEGGMAGKVVEDEEEAEAEVGGEGDCE